TARAMLGYRMQEHPFVDSGARRYQGLVVGALLTRTLGLASSATLTANRTTLLSAFEGNGFYVTNQLQGATVLRLRYGFSFEGGAGYRWNEYRAAAPEIGRPRHDSIFDWSVGLRRSLGSGSIGTSYQRQYRRSN